jgi:hypothetical protein
LFFSLRICIADYTCPFSQLIFRINISATQIKQKRFEGKTPFVLASLEKKKKERKEGPFSVTRIFR